MGHYIDLGLVDGYHHPFYHGRRDPKLLERLLYR